MVSGPEPCVIERFTVCRSCGGLCYEGEVDIGGNCPECEPDAPKDEW